MKTLIVYASNHGTTGKCAGILSERLQGEVQLYPLKEKKELNLSSFDQVVIGGSIYAGKIQKEVSDFCTRNVEKLQDKKIGLFICCMDKEGAEKQLTSSFPPELLDKAVAKESFGGEMRFSDMNFAEKLIMKVISKMVGKKDPNFANLDTKKDTSMLSHDKIEAFLQKMA